MKKIAIEYQGKEYILESISSFGDIQTQMFAKYPQFKEGITISCEI